MGVLALIVSVALLLPSAIAIQPSIFGFLTGSYVVSLDLSVGMWRAIVAMGVLGGAAGVAGVWLISWGSRPRAAFVSTPPNQRRRPDHHSISKLPVSRTGVPRDERHRR